MKDKPLISVLMPVYNASKYLTFSIESILNQAFTDFEFIIINDGSYDNSEEIIMSYKDSRILYIKNETNLKLIQTLNKGLSVASGKYIARMDADDIANPDRFEKQVHFLENNSEYGIVGSFAETFGIKKQVLKYVEDDADIRYALISHNPFIHSTVMLRRSILTIYKLQYCRDQLHVEDYGLWIRMMNYTKGKILPEILVSYRLHCDQISEVYVNEQLINTNHVQANYLNALGYTSDEIEIILLLIKKTSLNISKLLDFSFRIIDLSAKFPFEETREQFFKLLHSEIKNQLLQTKQLSYKEFFYILTKTKLFTLKQKTAFLIKVFK